MSQQDKIGFFKWITNMGLVMFISFSYFYYGPINRLEQKTIELNNEIQIDNIEIDNTSSNTIKVRLIKSNLIKAEAFDKLGRNLSIYRGVAVLFILVGFTSMLVGLRHIKNHYFPPSEKTAEKEQESAEKV